MVRRRFSILFVEFILAAAALPVSAQNPGQNKPQSPPAQAPATTVMPTDPTELMRLAAQLNGLDFPDMKPWHVKATYQTFDEKGEPRDQGTFEEWWAGPEKDKRVYTSPSFTQTEYITPAGRFRVGSQDGPPLAESMVRARLVSPMPMEADFRSVQIQRRDNPFPKSKLACAELVPPLKRLEAGYPIGVFPVYCFDQDKPILRFSSSYGLLNSSYERIGLLAGHYIGLDLGISDWKNTFATVHVEGANLLAQVNDADFIPPVEAQVLPAGGTATVAPSVLAGRKLSGSVPAYPSAAKQESVEGTVRLAAIIGEDGHIRELRVIEAPDAILARSALIAVHDWQYQPYLLNGHPVEVQTEIKVIYQLGR